MPRGRTRRASTRKRNVKTAKETDAPPADTEVSDNAAAEEPASKRRRVQIADPPALEEVSAPEEEHVPAPDVEMAEDEPEQVAPRRSTRRRRTAAPVRKAAPKKKASKRAKKAVPPPVVEEPEPSPPAVKESKDEADDTYDPRESLAHRVESLQVEVKNKDKEVEKLQAQVTKLQSQKKKGGRRSTRSAAAAVSEEVVADENTFALHSVLGDIDNKAVKDWNETHDSTFGDDNSDEVTETKEESKRWKEINKSLKSHSNRIGNWSDALATDKESENTAPDGDLSGPQIWDLASNQDSVINDTHNQLTKLDSFTDELSAMQSFLFDGLTKIQTTISTSQRGLEAIETSVATTMSDRESKVAALRQLFTECNELIDSENALQIERYSVSAKLEQLTQRLDKFKFGTEQYTALSNQYSDFKKDATERIPEMKALLEAHWRAFEARWQQWSADDIVVFFRNKFDWFRYGYGGNGRKTREYKFTAALKSADIDGQKLAGLDTTTLLDLGIDNHNHRSDMVNAVDQLIKAYPASQESAPEIDLTGDDDTEEVIVVKDDAETREVVDIESEEAVAPPTAAGGDAEVIDVDVTNDEAAAAAEVENNDKQMVSGVAIPKRFLCPLSQQIMAEPVHCLFDNKKYDKSALLTWLGENDTSPVTGEKIEDWNHEDSDNPYHLFYGDDELATEIQDFREENDF